MKKIILLYAGLFTFIFLFASACSTQLQDTSEIVEIDLLRKDYPVKEIHLNEIADISYIRFDSDKEEYLFDGFVSNLTDKTIVIFSQRAGDVFFFSRTGKFISKFNRRGNGPGEYNFITACVYNEQNDELFVLAMGGTPQIRVYDHLGQYKRKLDLPAQSMVTEIADWDDSSLLILDSYHTSELLFNKGKQLSGDDATDIPCEDCFTSSFVLISKQDGSVIENIPVTEDYSYLKARITAGPSGRSMPIGGIKNSIMKYRDGYILSSKQNDTIFYYDKKSALVPLWVEVPAGKAETTNNYLNAFVEAGEYQFFEKTLLDGDVLPIPTDLLVREKETGSIYTQKMIFDEYKGFEFGIRPKMILRVSDPATGYLSFSVDELKEAYGENKLTGRLKELVEDLDEDENNIFMLLKFK